MLNKCFLVGNLGADPEEAFFSSDGIPVTSFNLAFKSSKKKTCWIKVTCFNRLAEISCKHLHKGARVAVIGTLDESRWEDDQGFTRRKFQLIAKSLEFIKTDGRGWNDDQSEEDVPI
jgi:single-strand DNA-binding protein